LAEVQVTGLEQLKNFLSVLPARVKESTDNIMSVAAAMTEQESKRIVPVRTGTLQRSIRSKKTKQCEWFVGSDIFYAGFVEYGTSRMHARPYLRPAWWLVEPRLRAALLGILDKAFQ
jgi:HK97 gp10 family phage protein